MLLVVTRVFAWEFHFDEKGFAVREAKAVNICLTVSAHVDDAAVLGIKLPYRVIPRVAAVGTQGGDY